MNRNEDSYRVQTMNNCKLVFGSVPMQDMVDLTTAAPEGALMDLHLASLTGATMVFGMPDDLKALKEREDLPMCPNRIQNHKQATENEDLPDAFCEWLLTGHRGRSSDYMAHCVTGIPQTQEFAYPHDTDDFKRCLTVIDTLSDRSEASILDRMAEAPHPWPALVNEWVTLKRLSAESSSTCSERIRELTRQS
ncbi:MAG: hypothetical protein AWU57_276 [Marinobacter sp. T13-3]|nr:MAG: hypothetical protein AWU57_276 [Marinobacter sp. T13-3]